MWLAGYTAAENPDRGEEAYNAAVQEASEKAAQFKLPYLSELLPSWYSTGWHSRCAHTCNQSLAPAETI